MQAQNRFLTRSALFAALMCILAPLAIPVGPIPVTMGVFVVLFAAVVLDWEQACAAVGVYLLLGMVGLPVFSAGQGGIGVLFGPTGGYIWSYLPMTVIAAWVSGRSRTTWMAFAACVAALAICYVCGTLQFMLVAQVGLKSALASCVYPFVVFDVIKCAAAAALGSRIRRRLEKL